MPACDADGAHAQERFANRTRWLKHKAAAAKNLRQFTLKYTTLGSKCPTVHQIFSASLDEGRLKSQRLKIHQCSVRQKEMCLRLLVCLTLTVSCPLLNVLPHYPDLKALLPLSEIDDVLDF